MTGLRTVRGRCLTAGASLLYLIVVLLGTPRSARALVFNITYDSSTVGAPANFFTAFNYTANFYEGAFSDPVTINLQVGWGLINGQPLNPGNLGQSLTYQQGFYTYDQVKTALVNDAKTPSDAIAVANLPLVYPVSGTNFVMSNAEAKALGLLAGNATDLDGYVGFKSSGASYTFDPNNRAVSGEYDFIGLAAHEITEIMGRYGLGQNGASSGRFSPIDLFRYSSVGALDTTPANGAYFSIDSGITNINTFNGTGGGDLSDWLGLTLDPYNAGLTAGKQLSESPGDMTEMDAIGWDLAIPEPATFSLVLLGIAPLVLARRRRGK
ncbi:MAG TPA: NF038122 family metalloprotease [Tepidisphaeraceae bacterium]|nr:NF038122 family metalloprotease [Tepidisphaeraceae bacterium]